MKLADLVDQAAAIEAALRDAAAATIAGDALAGALSRGARLRLIIDFGARPAAAGQVGLARLRLD